MNKDILVEREFRELIQKSVLLSKTQVQGAELVALQALELAEKHHKPLLSVEAHYQLAEYYTKSAGDYKLSVDHCNTAIKILEEHPDTLLLVNLLKTLGVNAHFMGNWEDSQEYYLKGIEVAEAARELTIPLKNELGYLYHNISVLHKTSESKDYPLQCLHKAFDYFQETGNKQGLARCFNLYGNHQTDLRNYEVAVEYHLKSYELFTELNEIYFASVIQNNLGIVYCELGRFDEGFKHLFASLAVKEISNNKNGLSASYINLGLGFMLKNDHEEAIKYMHLAEATLQELESKSDLSTVYQHLSELYSKVQNFEKAFKYHLIYDKSKDEMFNFDKAAAIMDAKSKFELEKKRKEAELLRQKNIEIENYAHQLEVSNNELKQFAHVASHDLKEPLHMISNYIKLLEKRLANQMSSDARDYMDFLNEGAERMYSLINSLLSLSKITSEYTTEQVDMHAIINQVQKELGTNHTEDISVTTSDMPLIVANTNYMIQLFSNLISNSIKFNRNKKITIDIQAIRTEKEVTFKITDNGIGISPEYFDKIFVVFQRLNARDEFPGTGIGLAMCKKIVDAMRGKIWVEQNQIGGSTFILSIPQS